jgi:nucleoside-diphosphate-sugar epimerase
VGIFPQNAEILTGDVNDQVAVQSAMQGVDAVVHMAALLHIVNPPPEYLGVASTLLTGRSELDKQVP